MCRAPFVITPSVPQPYPAISQLQFIHSSELRDNHLPTIQQPRSNHDSTILRVESKNDSDITIHIRDSPNPTQPQPQQIVGRISPDDRREEPRSGRYAGCRFAPL